MAEDVLGRIDATPHFGVGRVLADSFRLLFRNFVPFLAIAVVLAVPSVAARLWASGFPRVPGHLGAHFAWTMIALLVGMVCGALTSSALTFGTLQDLRGQRAGIGPCVSRGLAAAPKVFAAALLWSLFVTFGYVLLVIPGVIISIMLWVYVPVIVVEGAGITDSFGRSRALTSGHRWGIFGLFCLFIAVFGTAEIIILVILGAANLRTGGLESGWPFWALTALSVIATAFVAVSTAVGYSYLRAEKEGVMIDDLAKVFD